jgi:alanyl-tRNA synthetase
MDAKQVRNIFFKFFESKQHKIVPSAPMVVRNDPTLMFTNAGMNQFKDIFLGNETPIGKRIANTQKCLRVSGKHNDLEEVGHDTYHHTMFEMLGNWSFGDYFKKEAIEWGWELLTDVYKIDKANLYVTVFEGDKEEGLPVDGEALKWWKTIVPEDRIIFGTKKDNFWEMGETGPCGPCSEIHVDIRDEKEKAKIAGRNLVNTSHPEVIEIWNLVFIEFNRKSDGKLAPLPAKHVDTGMGLERLTMVMQGKKSNYDTDIFQSVINEISKISGKPYGNDEQVDVAMRVVADHLRAVVFAIADGQLPSNIKAGYVIRRILRRAIRYAFTFLEMKEPFIFRLQDVLARKMGDVFPEIEVQKDLIQKVIEEEEHSFLRTLSVGIKKFDQYLSEHPDYKIIDGSFAFELFDTYGFPIDLTQLMAREKGWDVDMKGFAEGLEEQKKRSRHAAKKDTEDWVVVHEGSEKTVFLGYEHLEAEVRIMRYRKITEKKKEYYQIVLDKTPFYAESGGQVGDRGILEQNGQVTEIIDTQKENELIIHISKKIPQHPDETFIAIVDAEKRKNTANNHTATHLMHAALKKVLGNHVEQKGSLVDENHLRFDFAHFAKLSKEELSRIEALVNEKIRENIPIGEMRQIPIKEALDMGAVALFGEKYGEEVRVISFDRDYSVELCGGTHVPATGQIGFFKIVSEGAIAAGIRRIEAITAKKAEDFINEQVEIVDELKATFKSQKDIIRAVNNLMEQNSQMQKQIEALQKEKAMQLLDSLLVQVKELNGVNFLAHKVDLEPGAIKDLAFQLKNKVDDLFLLLGSVKDDKATLTVAVSESLVRERGIHAGNIVRELAHEINGGGGGQPHFATAGGKNINGLEKAFDKAREILQGI